MSEKGNIILGIDLGTTTCQAHFYDSKLRAVKDPENVSIVIDSIFGVDKNGEIVIGNENKVMADCKPENIVERVKNHMGDLDKSWTINDKIYSPIDIASEYLKYIKKYCEDGRQKFDQVVVTVPAEFMAVEIDATKAAAKMAGFKEVNIIKEPTAAALAYAMEEDLEDYAKVLVYDLGGGTFDVSVGECKGKIIEIISSAGDRHLGGKDFDNLLLKHVASDIKKEHGINILTKKYTSKQIPLRFACEKAKKQLSFKDKTKISIPDFLEKDGKPIAISMEITRDKFESLIKPMLEKTGKAINLALKDAKKTKKIDDIDLVLLVGGSTRIPLVKNIVEEIMNKEPKNLIDPDLAVSMGAAYYGGILSSRVKGVIMDVTSASLGAQVAMKVGDGHWVDNAYFEIVPRNWPVSKPHSDTFSTTEDYQEEAPFNVYQREPMSQANFIDEGNKEFSYIGSVEVKGIPPKPAGEETITATYCVDTNAMVQVEIIIDSTKKKINRDFDIKNLKKGEIKTQKPEETTDSPEIEKNLEQWKESPLAKEHKSTISQAEKQLKKSANKKLQKLVDDLKSAIIDDDKSSATKFGDELVDFLFDLDI